jgi:hypothetical protein
LAGNANSTTTRTITLDTTAPFVNMTYPAADLNLSGLSMTFNYTFEDNTSGVQNCSLIVNGSIAQTSLTNYSHTFQTPGDYRCLISCNDYAGNQGNSSAIIVTATSTSVSTGGGGAGNYVTTVLSNETPFLSYTSKKEGMMCPEEKNIFKRITSSCKLNNSYCDDGENPILDKDCKVTAKEFTSGSFFKSMWVIRLLFIAGIILFITKKREYLPFVGLILIVLLLVNGAVTLPQATTTSGFFAQLHHNAVYILKKISLDWKVIIPIILAFYLFVIYPKRTKR